MTEDRAASGRGDDVVGDGKGERRYIETNGIVNPESAEGCAPRTGNEFGYKISDRVGQHRKDNATDDVPSADIQVWEPGSEKWHDKLEDHQNEGKDDESAYHERNLCPLQRLAEAGSNQHPSR